MERPPAKKYAPVIARLYGKEYMRPFGERCHPAYAGMMINDTLVQEPKHPWRIKYPETKPASILAPAGYNQYEHDKKVSGYLGQMHKNFRSCEEWLRYQAFYGESKAHAEQRRDVLLNFYKRGMQVHDWCRNEAVTKLKGCGLKSPDFYAVTNRKRAGGVEADRAWSEEMIQPLAQPPGALAVVKKGAKVDLPKECSVDGYLQCVDLESETIKAKRTATAAIAEKQGPIEDMASKWRTLKYGDIQKNLEHIQGLPGARAMLFKGSPLCGGEETISMHFFEASLAAMTEDKIEDSFTEEICSQCTHYLFLPEYEMVMFAMHVDSYQKACDWHLPWFGPHGRDATASEDSGHYFYLTLVCALTGAERLATKTPSVGALGIMSLFQLAESMGCRRVVLSAMPTVFFYYVTQFDAQPIRRDCGKQGGFQLDEPGEGGRGLRNFPTLPIEWVNEAKKFVKANDLIDKFLPPEVAHPLEPLSFSQYQKKTRAMFELELTARYFYALEEIYKESKAIEEENNLGINTDIRKTVRHTLRAEAKELAEEVKKLQDKAKLNDRSMGEPRQLKTTTPPTPTAS
jgi:hypothetical protein